MFFFNDTATTEIYTLSLHDALPISRWPPRGRGPGPRRCPTRRSRPDRPDHRSGGTRAPSATGDGRRRTCSRSEEHTSELQSRQYLVCSLLLVKKIEIIYSSKHCCLE